MSTNLTERQKRIMELAIKRHNGNLNLAAKEDKLVGMAMIRCLGSLYSKSYSCIQDDQYFLTEDGYAAIGIPIKKNANQLNEKKTNRNKNRKSCSNVEKKRGNNHRRNYGCNRLEVTHGESFHL